MLEQILPAGVAVEEVFGDVPDAKLLPEEEAVIATAVARRRTEFATARACARAALARLGEPAVPILAGAKGAQASSPWGWTPSRTTRSPMASSA